MVRKRGTSSAARNAIASSPKAISRVSQSMPELESELEVESAAMLSVARPEIVMTMINRIWMQKPLKLSIIPIDTAPAAGTPTRSKNRISRATLAAELGTASAMNWIPYWSIRTGQ